MVPSARTPRAGRRGARMALVTLVTLLAGSLPLATATAQTVAFPAPSWVDTLGQIAISSPTMADIDGVQAVVFGSQNGYVYAIDAANGENLPGWPEPVELEPGVPTAIESSPTVAYLDGADKPPTIIVGAGSTYVKDQQGGLVAFYANGKVRFVFNTLDVYHEWNGASTPGPDGYDDAVFSTPAVGDITGTGQQDIVFGSWDHELYALTPNGAPVPGFPFQTEDTVWSSPALFHVRGVASEKDVFIGGDASGRDGCHGGFIYDFTYRSGAPKIAWQHCEQQTIWSSPAVGVINSTERPAVVVGTGFGEHPPYTSASDQVFAFYADTGRPVEGWPVRTTGPVFGSPAIGMLPGSTAPAVVDTSWCTACDRSSNAGTSEVDAWAGTGRLLWNQTLNGPNDFASPVLVDLTGSGTNDVLVGSSGGLYPLDGADGDFMFNTGMRNPINACSMQNSVAIADITGSGPGTGWHMFEACGGPHEVTDIGRLYDYPLPATPGTPPPWPMWRQSPDHEGVASSTIPPVSGPGASL